MRDDNLLLEILSESELDSLCLAYGGREYYVPMRGGSSPVAARLIDAMGAIGADKLMRWAGGSRLYIPLLKEREVAKRRIELLILRNAGMSLAQMAKHFTFTTRYTERNIQRLIRQE